MDDFKGRYPRATNTLPRPHISRHTEKNTAHREISTKALTKSSRLQHEEDIWDDEHYPEFFENQGFEDEIVEHPTTYNKQEQRVSKFVPFSFIKLYTQSFSMAELII